jgi:hypothetical protein
VFGIAKSELVVIDVYDVAFVCPAGFCVDAVAVEAGDVE